METAIHFTDSQGKQRARGSNQLKSSQAYPIGFGVYHARAFHEFRRTSEWRRQLAPLPFFVPGLEAPDDMGCFQDIDLGHSDLWRHNLAAELAVPLGA